MLVRLGRVAAWVVIVLLAREFIVTGLRTIAASRGDGHRGRPGGKWKTGLQLTGIIALCVHYTHHLDLIFWTVPVNYNAVGQVLLYISVFFSVWSGVGYFRAFGQMLSRRGQAEGPEGA